MEEREKVVKHMWDAYTNSCRIRLMRFWQEAFEAGYEELTSDVPGVREDTITEIAKMSIRSVDLYHPRIQSISAREPRKSLKQTSMDS
ncbi:Polyol/monosaccharide transporter 5-like protein [Hibiscus syriacus]|uniref:Polyol/monosaccharide transporter 5-like protein n=1 Tax=Hibiscus syriacus TaxID=106335 RepID=A0A6A2Z135_HIBSY|nr:Polyol/monosaccharide transporter 5-like protein [Hibiscus syriacus]